jgi:hypothetical protein
MNSVRAWRCPADAKREYFVDVAPWRASAAVPARPIGTKRHCSGRPLGALRCTCRCGHREIRLGQFLPEVQPRGCERAGTCRKCAARTFAACPPRSGSRPGRVFGTVEIAVTAVGDQSDGPSAQQAKLYAPHPVAEVMPSLWHSAQAFNTKHAAARRIKVFMLWVPSVFVCRIAKAEWSNAKHSAECSLKGEPSPDLEATLFRTGFLAHHRSFSQFACNCLRGSAVCPRSAVTSASCCRRPSRDSRASVHPLGMVPCRATRLSSRVRVQVRCGCVAQCALAYGRLYAISVS